MRRLLAAALVALVARSPAAAQSLRGGRLAGTVRVTRAGAAVPDPGSIVVYVVGFAEPPPSRAETIAQRDKRFVPELLPIVVGQEVSFPNGDPFFHNVFSLSRARRFDLGQYKAGNAKTKGFSRSGVVDIFCNIHPQMAATILVLPNRRFAQVGGAGEFAIEGVPPGTWQAYAFSRLADEPAVATVTIRPGRTTEVAFDLELTRTGFEHRNKYGERYRDPIEYRHH